MNIDLQLLRLVNYLERCNDRLPCTDVIPAIIQLRGKVYAGARYSQSGESRWYVIGGLPKSHKGGTERTDGTIYTVAEGLDAGEYYAGGWMASDTIKPEFVQHHPFGVWFGLYVYSEKFQPIDKAKAPKESLIITRYTVADLKESLDSSDKCADVSCDNGRACSGCDCCEVCCPKWHDKVTK